LLKIRLAQLHTATSPSNWLARPLAASLAIVCVLIFLVHSLVDRQDVRGRNHSRRLAIAFSIPDSKLTPGAALLANRQAVCAQENVKNKADPVALQRKVFEEYGIADAEPQA